MRRTRWVVVPLLIIVSAVVATAGPRPAHAGPIEAKKAEAARVEAHVMALNAEVDAKVQAYDAAQSRLKDAKHRVAVNTRLLGVAKSNLRVARHQLASILVSGYKNATPGVEVYVLGATSVENLVDRIDFLSRANKSERDVLAQIHTSEAQIKHHQAQLIAERRQARHLVKTRAAQARQVQALLTQQSSLLNSIKGDIAHLIQQQQARERQRARRAAAAAAAAAQAAKVATPSGGGSQTASSGGGSTTTGGGDGSSPPVTIPPAGSLGEKAVQIAEQELGVPYVWGGASPAGFDCSGLTMWVYAQLGIHLDHYTGSQWNEGVHVPESQLAPGDLVFFEPTLGHVGMYIGNGAFIHAPHTGTVVQISSLSDPWYSSEYQGAVRVTG
jgi:cell wall-associated NlpC family hydrolase